MSFNFFTIFKIFLRLKIGLSQEISKKNEKGKSKISGLFSKNSQPKDQILKKTLNDFNFLQKLVFYNYSKISLLNFEKGQCLDGNHSR